MNGLRFGYGTNGFAHHRLDDALAVIAELGYVGVALTLDHHHLDPFAPDVVQQVNRLAKRLDLLGLSVVVETGARYLLDARRKHAPTLLDSDPSPRIDFLKRAIDIAALLEAEAVSFWAGVGPARAWPRLVAGCLEVAAYAADKGVPLGFEPEPGMLVETITQWEELRAQVPDLKLTLDIGHCRAIEDEDVPECVKRALPHLVNVQIEDMRRGVHEHLEFGAGEIDFPPVLRALRDYTGLVTVELPRHSHAAPQVAARSLDFLEAKQWLGEALSKVDPQTIGSLLAMAGRRSGREHAEAARTRLLREARLTPQAVTELYRYGDNDEKRAVLLACPTPELLDDALRSNDSRLVAAALGPHANLLTDPQWRQGVLKSVFMGLPLTCVHDLEQRADAELGRMLDGLRAEREAAGRRLPADAVALLERLG